MNRLALRLTLAMLLVALLSLLVVPIAQTLAVQRTIQRLPDDFRERVQNETRPAANGRKPPPRPGQRQPPANIFLQSEVSRLFSLLADYRQVQRRSVLFGSLAALGLSLLLAYWLSKGIAKPIEAVSRASSKIAHGDFSARVNLNYPLPAQETQQLAEDFNAMAENLEYLEQNRKAMMADIAHELRNPLATMQFRLDALEDGVLPLESKEITTLQDQLALLSRLVEDLRTLSLADTKKLSLERRTLDLVALCHMGIQSFSSKAQQQKIDLQFLNDTETVLIYADPDRLLQVLGNLLDNAFKATPEGGWIQLLLEPHDQAVDITVKDSGRGIPEDVLPHLFERFVQGKRRDTKHKGSGLGLAIAYTLVELHGGELHASNHAQGAQVRMRLPLSTELSRPAY